MPKIAYQNLRSRLIAGEVLPGSRIRYGHIAAGLELSLHAFEAQETNRWEVP